MGGVRPLTPTNFFFPTPGYRRRNVHPKGHLLNPAMHPGRNQGWEGKSWRRQGDMREERDKQGVEGENWGGVGRENSGWEGKAGDGFCRFAPNGGEIKKDTKCFYAHNF